MIDFKFFRFIVSEIKQGFYQRLEFYRLQQRYPDCKFLRPLRIINAEKLILGNRVQIRSNCYLHCGGYEWSKGEGYIKIGEDSWLAENMIIYGAGGIEIGKSTGLGPGTMLFSSRDDYSKELAFLPEIVHRFAKITIGDYVRIFARVTIAPGVTIGEGAVIGAGSVVTKDIPPWTIAMGVPAKVVGKREKDKSRNIPT